MARPPSRTTAPPMPTAAVSPAARHARPAQKPRAQVAPVSKTSWLRWIGQLALRRLLLATGNVSGCLKPRSATASQPLRPRCPAVSGLFSAWSGAAGAEDLGLLQVLSHPRHGWQRARGRRLRAPQHHRFRRGQPEDGQSEEGGHLHCRSTQCKEADTTQVISSENAPPSDRQAVRQSLSLSHNRHSQDPGCSTLKR